ncbi:zinc finger protein 2 isoform X3 [Lutzomyia longipalpis]|uniref:zinc finger protein 2 isoform X3 n=1 Tax=Lutzomyia longipalpis TaxID=7200 RepID=UPI00248402F1|nr:zinc finger protein 2 isoform X3 [Lutzomyia longipalpis]
MAKSPPPNAKQEAIAMPPPSLESPTSDSAPRKRRRKRDDPQSCSTTAELDYDSDEASPQSCSDVESFQGKIVYNSDGSAYIIDSDNDSLSHISDSCAAGVVSPNNPKIHSFRVVMAREASVNISELNRISKPVLMCFICKLSFGNAKSFGIHANSEHNLNLLESEKTLLSREYSSAILQRNIDERPQISFLEPLTNHQLPQMGTEKLNEDAPVVPKVEQDYVPTIGCTPYASSAGGSVATSAAETPQPENLSSPEPKVESSPPESQQQQQQQQIQAPQPKTPPMQLSTSPATDAKNYVPTMSPTSTVAPSFTIGACPDHINGRPLGVDCIRCEMILSSARLGSASQISTRNSCKTLKCPQCNWHYKYQETLEIHMREKHPDGESACGYCLAGQQHPRLARGESYTCGYKPYRCEICNYSTTTKGNLSIHMQSDKHLNNMQELNSTQSLAAAPAPVSVAEPHDGPKMLMSQAGGVQSVAAKPKPSFRCDVCSYETSVARNLRIHMTSEKHTHNMAVLQNNIKHLQALSIIQHTQNMGQAGQLSGLPSLGQNIPASIQNFLPEAALADLAYNQALMIQLLQQAGGGQAAAAAAPTPGGRISPATNMGMNSVCNMAEPDTGMSPETFEPPFEIDTKPMALFTCLVCATFSTNSLDELNGHLLADRTRTPGADVMLILGGNYICRLCNYKTNLKANFQLHSKTDKHLQKVAYMNHLREGGATNEYKLKYSGTSVVQLKCNACDYYTNSIQKLGLHCQHMRHDAQKIVFQYILSLLEADEAAPLHCQLCNVTVPHTLALMQHIKGIRHAQIEQIVSLQRRSDGFEGLTLAQMYKLVEPDASSSCSAIKSEDQSPAQSPSRVPSITDVPPPSKAPSAISEADPEDAEHEETDKHEEEPSEEVSISCPLCQEAFSDKTSLEQHVMGVHSVSTDGLSRLLHLVDSSQWPKRSPPQNEASTEIECSACGNSMRTFHELLAHSNEKQHFHHTNDAYVCILRSCQQVFPSIPPLIQHYKDTHLNIVISERHVYKYRCKLCSLAFKTQDKLNKHSVYHAMRDATKCAHCGRSFRTALALQKHMDQVHSPNNQGEVGNYQEMPIKGELDLEMLDESGEAQCSAEASEEELSACTEDHDPARKHQCTKCRVAFTHQNFLMQHYRSPTHRRNEARPTATSTYPIEKYLDPNRPFKCEICRESFTQKNILLVHYNSVSHLHKLKKHTETPTPSSSPGQDLEQRLPEEMMEQDMTEAETETESKALKRKLLPEDDYESPKKRFKCDICKVAYAQGSTLDIHMRSVLHQTRACRLQEQQQLVPKVQHDISTAVVVSASVSPTPSTVSQEVMSPTDEEGPKINNHVYKTLLENFGFDLVKQFNEINKHGSEGIQEERYYCRHCKKTFSSIFVLKSHCEEMHNETIPVDFLEKFAEKFKTYYFESGYLEAGDVLDYSKRQDLKVAPKGTKIPGIPVSFSIASTSTLKIPQVTAGAGGGGGGGGGGAVVEPPTTPETPESQFVAQKLLEQQNLASLPPSVAANLSHNLSQSFQTIHNFGNNLPFNTLDMLNLMQIHHLMSLNFMNMAPPLIYGAGQAQPAAGAVPAADLPPAAAQTQQLLQQHNVATQIAATNQAQGNQKRARTRITDEQLKILRAHFDINNSPSEESIMEMSKKANLPMKVVKHWFRNTLFKERQRNKDSPYNFNNPPSTTLNLEEYERTGQAKIIKLMNEEHQAQQKFDERKEIHHESVSPKPTDMVVKQECAEPMERGGVEEMEPGAHLSSCNSMSSNGDNIFQFEAKSEGPDPTSRPQTPMTGAFPAIGELLGQQMDGQNMGPPKKYNLPPKIFDAKAPFEPPPAQMGPQPQSSGSSSSGKRANRTRFTDYQIKVLQEFFENNSYPKDSDLEYLSKLLLLSPRVIVVWFQNARQKQRKIYENQPNNSFFESEEKKSNINYTCKKCNLVFQRYYELIRHQKNHCFKEENNKKSAKAQIAAAQIAHSLSSEDSNSSIDVGHQGVTTQMGTATEHDGLGLAMAGQQIQSLIGTVPLSVPLATSPNLPTSVSNSATVHGEPDGAPEAPDVDVGHHHQACHGGGGSSISGGVGGAFAEPPPLPLGCSNGESPSTAAAAGVDAKLECDKCSAIFTRHDLHREHHRLHTTTTTEDGSIGSGTVNMAHAADAQQQQQQLVKDDDPQLDYLIRAFDSPEHSDSQSPGDMALLDDSNGPPEHQPPGTAPRDPPTSNKRLRTTILPEQLNYLYECYQNESNPSRKMLEEISKKVNLKKRVVQVWYQNSRARERKGQFRQNLQLINKKCPFCSAIFKIKSALESHLQMKHPDEMPVSIDQIPDVGPGFLGGGCGATTPTEQKAPAPLDLRNAIVPQQPFDGHLAQQQQHLKKASPELKNGFKGFNGFKADEAAPIEILDRIVGLPPGSLGAGGGPSALLGNHKKRHRCQMTNIQIAILSNLFGAFEPPVIKCEKNDLALSKKIVHLSEGHYIDDFVYLI